MDALVKWIPTAQLSSSGILPYKSTSINALDRTFNKLFKLSKRLIKQEPESWILIATSSNEGSGESAQMRRLAKAFVAHIYKVWMSIKAQDQNLEISPHFVRQHGRLQDAFAHG